MPCLPRCSTGIDVPCTKEGGVCSIRQYCQNAAGQVNAAEGKLGFFTATCPYRFYERNMVFRWIGETILGSTTPYIVNQVKSLEREGSAVGRIDHVLIHHDTKNFSWCALEMQAVYFSGGKMIDEFRAVAESTGESIPFPVRRRRPDVRSSGPKRLMPQLQIKVPTLRRWGKKMCVLVDRAFFEQLGRMASENDLTNSDIAWFVVNFEEDAAGAHLVRDFVHYTTLERAVEGLTAGLPVSLPVFERRIRSKLESLLHGGQPVE
jgi:hypothetical protein